MSAHTWDVANTLHTLRRVYPSLRETHFVYIHVWRILQGNCGRSGPPQQCLVLRIPHVLTRSVRRPTRRPRIKLPLDNLSFSHNQRRLPSTTALRTQIRLKRLRFSADQFLIRLTLGCLQTARVFLRTPSWVRLSCSEHRCQCTRCWTCFVVDGTRPHMAAVVTTAR